jgi:hypothetical protein
MPLQKNDDLEKFNFYLHARFELFSSILLSSLIMKPSEREINKTISKIGKFETERLYNHFHMSAITNDATRQREYAVRLWNQWRTFFFNEMPHKNIVIEIIDQGNETILYVYQEVFV